MKRRIAYLLAIIMIVSMMPTTALDVLVSQYKQVILYYAMGNAEHTRAQYANNPKNRFLLTDTDSNCYMSPTEDTVIAERTYSIPAEGWTITKFTMDLADVDYNGDVYVSWDSLS